MLRLPIAPDRRGPLLFLLAVSAGLTGCGKDAPEIETGAIFEDVTDRVGLDFVHFNGATGDFYFPEIQGPGGALFDYDSDGDLDIYLVQGNLIVPGKTMADALTPAAHAVPLTDRLYRNDLDTASNGMPVFTDVTEEAQAGAGLYGSGVAVGDYNNDGHPDLYVTSLDSNRLLKNNGDGTFSDVTETTGTDEKRWSHSAAFLDYDRDGLLDLFVVNYVDFRLTNRKSCPDAAGNLDYCGPLSHGPETDTLFRNLGNGRFQRTSKHAGIDLPSAGLGVAVADVDADGWIDIYVANDAMENHLWMNQRDGRFRNEALQRGVAVDNQGRAEASMGVDFGDFDNDGDPDVFMSHLREETNTLFVNDGGGHFVEKTIVTGLAGPSIGMTGFGTVFFDYDNDGHQDIFVANGTVRAVQSLKQAGVVFPYGQRNQLFRNLGGKFEETGKDQSALSYPESGRGLAVGDVDNDGDPDLLVVNDNGRARLLLNRVGQDNHWLGFTPVAVDNRHTVGVTVELRLTDGTTLKRRSRVDASYLSANDPRVLFGLGDTGTGDRVTVTWPDGSVETWPVSERDRYRTLTQGSGTPVDVAND